MKISRVSELNRKIKDAVIREKDLDFPLEYIFSRGMEFSSYKITIEKLDPDFYIDAMGRKWVRAND